MTKRSLAAALLTVLAAAALLLPPTAAARWRPQPSSAAWQWQLQGKIDTSIEAGVYEVDGFEVGARTVARLHRLGRKVVCYLDVGSWESYRPDADRFPQALLGRAYEGYPDERWLDIRRLDLLAPILRQRIDVCRRKGFDAVEPDNVAGFENETGFPLGAGDQLRFNRWVAREVHRRGMAVALKNDPRQVRQLLGSFDFAVVEECFAYDECGRFSPFVAAGKRVFVAEYQQPLAAICAEAERLRFSVIHKDYDLFARPWEPCFP
ncbi:MAG TPA: endo alpha-1,4 polygalactosaminidase [Solirubrobacterales bacterium]|nr:endo alpha-1,4 polygalactosaminidase [Solirubrobacterales bacterium]